MSATIFSLQENQRSARSQLCVGRSEHYVVQTQEGLEEADGKLSVNNSNTALLFVAYIMLYVVLATGIF